MILACFSNTVRQDIYLFPDKYMSGIMNDKIQLVDIVQMGDEMDTELIKDEIQKRFDKIQSINESSKAKIYFKKHHDNPQGSPKYEVRVSVETPHKTFMSEKTDFSVIDAVTNAMDSAEKETRKYFDKRKAERINDARLSV